MTTAELISKAKEMVVQGATIEVRLPDGITVGPNPVASMFLDKDSLRYVWAGDDHTHIHDVLRIVAGDDGEVLVTPKPDDGMLLTIWGIWDDRHRGVLERFMQQIEAGTLIWWLEGGLTGAVDYGGTVIVDRADRPAA